MYEANTPKISNFWIFYVDNSVNPKRDMRGPCRPRKTLTGAAIVHVMPLRFWGPRGPGIYFSVSVFAYSF